MGTHEQNVAAVQATNRASTQRCNEHVCRVNLLAQATKHASTQCVCKPQPDFQGKQLVQNIATYTVHE